MKNLQVTIVTDVETEPVTLEEVKNFCKISTSQDDELLAILIKSARESVEKYCCISVAEKAINATWVTLPDDKLLILPYGPIASVDKVYTIDNEGNETLLTVNTDYYVYGDEDLMVKILPVYVTGKYYYSSVRVEYTAGYDCETTEALPAAIKQAIMKQVATDYNYRDDIIEGSFGLLTNGVKALLAPYRKFVWF